MYTIRTLLDKAKPLLAATAGSTLLLLGLGLNTYLVVPLAASLMSIGLFAARQVMRESANKSSDGITVYEIMPKHETSRREVTSRIKSLFTTVTSLAKVSDKVTIIGYACCKKGCSVVLITSEGDKHIESLLKSVLEDLFVVRRMKSLPLRTSRSNLEVKYVDVPLTATDEENSASQTTSEYSVTLGVRRDGSTVMVPIDFVWRHVAVYGTTGSGKTTTTFAIASQLARWFRVIVVDWHGEYEALASKYAVEYTTLDPPRLPLIPSDIEVEILVDVLEDAFDLTRHQTSLLYQALKQMLKRGVVPEELEDFTDNLLATIEVQQVLPSRAELEIRAALERRLKSLLTGEGKRLFTVTGKIDLPKEPGLYILRVDKILLMYLRRIYARILLAYLFYTTVTRKKPARTVIVLEEAHNIATSDAKTLPSILAEARKYQIGVFVVTQSPSSLHPGVLKNTNTRIVHTLKSAMDINVVARSMNLPSNLKDILPRLNVGQAIIDTPYHSTPMLVRIEPKLMIENG